ncbi:hypothetical protein B0H13DRAFT_1855527 [Mycena leptocephala]|nr:hypothetical protein B0H13DRAFT_1855527 [Mycena leptocephala]
MASASRIVTRLALSAVEANGQNAKSALLSSCYAAQAAFSASASFPRGYSIAVNDSPQAAQGALDFSLTVLEAIVNFFVDTYRSTFLCFLELVIQAGLAVLASAAAEQSFSAARSGIQSGISAANKIPGINIPTRFIVVLPTAALAIQQGATVQSGYIDDEIGLQEC